MKLLLSILLLSQLAFGVTANKVWVVPSGKTTPAWGAVNLSSSTAITGQMPSKTYLPTLGQQISSSCGTFSTTSSTFTDVTNLSVTLTTTGRPVFLSLNSDGGGTRSILSIISANLTEVDLKLLRGATEIARVGYQSTGTGTAYIPANFTQIDPVGAGTYTYKVQIRSNDNTTQVNLNNYQLVAFELD